MYQRARAEKSEVQDLIYGGGAGTGANKNYMRQNYEELQQIQRETQHKLQKQKADATKENKWVLKKFRDVKPKLDRTGGLSKENYKSEGHVQAPDHSRSKTQDHGRAPPAPTQGRKMTKAEKFKQMKMQGRPLDEKSQNNKEPPKRSSTLQSAGNDMISSTHSRGSYKRPEASYNPPKPKATHKPPQAPKREAPPASYKIGAHNPPPPEQPNIVYYTPESKEDIYALGEKVDPVAAHREKYAPRNIPVPKKKTQSKPFMEEEHKAPKKQIIPKEKGYIAPKKQKNYIKSNYKEAVDENSMKVKARGTVSNKEEAKGPKHKSFGKVPKYLNKYNNERKQQEEIKARMEADKDVPPGCKRMDEGERLATLRDLENNKKEVNTVLEKLPISMRTHALNKRRDELENKLVEIDRAIAMFSKKVVYIAL
ncbi:unnamed protein product [Moneuplotes crassus]|uniref:Enkurin domain-containing protein n=1 Tax=Euplotes crassus TaxID=5936 RepID=A0AAD1XDW8_EUPCR|nr:unnamed protein product [Moneuplotes crassus]